ncbi:1-aminocyclopropane-1-carboxylate deaminase [Aureitalea marina]|uniref:1-aminocyclopropane-1-carboxylate deaminase n=1 Tax=Aureitalea marina TaxID=930804 RepID=A0A2S7KTQ0_9FLAO|nr:1-aminocyclopropane-1-carboxylate deaminase [Aureitalea marina]
MPPVLIEPIRILGHNPSEVELSLLREDLIPSPVSGNKFRKLRYNYQHFRSEGFRSMVSFGGAHSNHIDSLACLGKITDIPTVGIIRGEELASKPLNPTLAKAKESGMKLYFVSRTAYRQKEASDEIRKILLQYPGHFLIPEGGTNQLAVKGCEEILGIHTREFTHICCATGTGGTLAGLIKSSANDQQVIGFSALKGTFQTEEIVKYTDKVNFEITDQACLGGYAKMDRSLIVFMNQLKEQTNIGLDPIYTGKMMMGLMGRIRDGHFPKNSRILAVHTGGLQGIPAMNQILIKKQLPLIR